MGFLVDDFVPLWGLGGDFNVNQVGSEGGVELVDNLDNGGRCVLRFV